MAGVVLFELHWSNPATGIRTYTVMTLPLLFHLPAHFLVRKNERIFVAADQKERRVALKLVHFYQVRQCQPVLEETRIALQICANVLSVYIYLKES